MILTGAQILIECLKEQGVDTIFGYPGGTILDVYDELYRHQDEIHHYLTSHEQGAAHAADGYARATGKVGVCFATSGPGATNLVTGIATAYMDSIPMVAVTCNVTLPLLGKDTFQEVDIAGITMPITKHGYIVKDISILAETVRKAFQIARSGRPGPVIVDITKNVTSAKAEFTPMTEEEKKKRWKLPRKTAYTEEDLETAAEMIRSAKRPFIYVGGGAVSSGAAGKVRELVEKIDAPVCDTLMGKGVINGYDRHYTGMIGMHGTKTSNLGVSQCDLLVALGARFSDRVTGNAKKFAPHAKILHIDIDAAEINKNMKATFSLVGDLSEILEELNNRIEPAEHAEWMAHIEEMKEKFPLLYDESVLTCPMIIRKLSELTGEDTIITTDVGQHQMWAAQFYTYTQPRSFLSSGGLGTMGYGLGAAIGAKVACPEKTVINIAGDGCFRMNMNELATASRYGIPVVEVVINNEVLGMVRQWQTLFYGKRYSQTILTDRVDYCKVAEGLGCRAFRITKPEEAEQILREALSCGEPALVECVIDQDDKVFPMVAPGTSIEEAFDERDLKERSKE